MTWEMYCEEIRPYWLMVTKNYGFTVDDIDWSCPADLEPYAKAHEKEIKEKDNLMWQMGLYVQSAVATAIEHNFAGKKAKSEYLKHPIHEMIEEEELKNNQDRREYKGMTDKEKQKAEWEKAKSYFNMLATRFSKKEKKEGQDKA